MGRAQSQHFFCLSYDNYWHGAYYKVLITVTVTGIKVIMLKSESQRLKLLKLPPCCQKVKMPNISLPYMFSWFWLNNSYAISSMFLWENAKMCLQYTSHIHHQNFHLKLNITIIINKVSFQYLCIFSYCFRPRSNNETLINDNYFISRQVPDNLKGYAFYYYI